jgi:hypothetical protein
VIGYIHAFERSKHMTEEKQDSDILYMSHPSMWRSSPGYFLLSVLSIPLFGLGIIILMFWYLKCKGIKFTITSSQITLEEGLLSKKINEVRLKDVKNVQLSQSFGERIFGSGTIGIASSGSDGLEIVVSGLPKPKEIRELINKHRD